jgi:cytochrome c oxidase assembly protein subunit 11
VTEARNKRVAVALTALVALMIGAAFAAVPLYRLFCQVTGFDGTTQRADSGARQVLDREVTVRFDTNVRGLPWRFSAEQVAQTARIGETKMAFFKVTNTSDRPLTGTAMYNVVPEVTGGYFTKLQCFCFEQQTIAAGATIEFPVLYFIDPEMVDDAEARGVREITLSYTFFPADAPSEGQGATVKASVPAAETLGAERAAGL